MNQLLFTTEEENLICMFDTNKRDVLMADIHSIINHIDEPEMREIAGNVLRKLNALTNEEFSELIFLPVYHDDESEV